MQVFLFIWKQGCGLSTLKMKQNLRIATSFHNQVRSDWILVRTLVWNNRTRLSRAGKATTGVADVDAREL